MWQIAYTIALASSASCPSYTCSNISSTSGTCIDYSKTEGIEHYTLTPCDLTLECSFETESLSTCRDYEPNTRYPGEYCQTNNDCFSNNCIDHSCVSSNSSNCNVTADCNPGSYCEQSSNICVNHSQTGESCFEDTDCQNFDLCHLFICTTMFSLNITDQTYILWGTFAPLCSTGYAVYDPESGISTCSIAPISNSSSLTDCPGEGYCTASDGITTKNCECGFDGKLYCPLFEGDEDVVKMIETWPLLFKDSEQYCNGGNPWGYDCFSHLDFNQSTYLDWAIRYNKYFFETWYTLPTAPLCAKNTVLKPYYNLELDYISHPTCQQFYQATDTSNWDLSQCSYPIFNIYDNSYLNAVFTAPCPDSQNCSLSSLNTNGTCEALVSLPGKPGEYCKTDSECYSARCVKDRCTGLQVGVICGKIATLLCEPGSFCNSNNICENVNQNKDCTSDASCNSKSLCFKGKCVEMFSVDNGGKGQVEDSSSYGYSRVCSSGFAYYDSQAKSVVCGQAPKTNGTFMASCELGDTVYDTTGNFSLKCACGLSGNAYFPGFVGDGNYFSDAVKSFKYFASRTSCYDNVWTLACLKYDSKLLYKYYQYYVNTQMLNYGYFYKNAPELFVKTYANEFYVALKYLNNTVESSSSFARVLIGVALFYLV